jgi:phage baseplate assembly protein W
MAQPFTSIRYPFAIDASRGRLQEENDYSQHIDQLVKQVLLTAPGERVNRPDFGCGIKRLVFAPNSKAAASLAQVTIFNALERWLGSAITVKDVKVTSRDEVLEIRVGYMVKARGEQRYLNLEVTL